MNQFRIRMFAVILTLCGAMSSFAQASDFTLNDINGKSLSLSSMRGKVVVLDFWGSWCIWCEKYKNKLEIIGMDCGDSDEKWKAAVKKYELPWKHVYVPKNSKVLDNYKIEGFPTKIVIAPDGTVLKKVVGESPDFYEYLDQYFISH